MGADQIETTPRLLSVVSYNIHQCVGSDRRRDATRIAAILKELNADIIGLQEVHSAHDGTFEAYQMRYLAETTGYHVVSGPNVTKTNSEYGNVLLTRHSVVRVSRLDLSVPGREARGAIDADIAIGNHVVRVIVSHLGLRARERRYQTKRLLGLLGQEKTSPIVALLDISSRRADSSFQSRIRQVSMLSQLSVFFSAVFSRSRLGQTICGVGQGATLHHARHPRRFRPSAAGSNDRYRALLVSLSTNHALFAPRSDCLSCFFRFDLVRRSLPIASLRLSSANTAASSVASASPESLAFFARRVNS